MNIRRAAFKTTLNLLSNTIFFVDLIQSIGTVGELRETMARIVKEFGTPNVADYFPILKKFDLHGVRRHTTIHFSKMLDIFHNLVSQHKKLRENTGSLTNNDILDTFLSKENRPDRSTFTLEWVMVELLRNPRVMSKAKAELEETIGKGKPIEESDIAKLPYLQEVLKETFRLYPPALFLLPKKAKKDVEQGGYVIPKGVQILVNV